MDVYAADRKRIGRSKEIVMATGKRERIISKGHSLSAIAQMPLINAQKVLRSHSQVVRYFSEVLVSIVLDCR